MRIMSPFTPRALPICAAAFAVLLPMIVAAASPTQGGSAAPPEVLASLNAKLALHPHLALKVAGIRKSPTSSLVKAKQAEPLDTCNTGADNAFSGSSALAPAKANVPPSRTAFSVRTWLAAAAAWLPKAGKPPSVSKSAATPQELALQKATATGAYAPPPPAKAYLP